MKRLTLPLLILCLSLLPGQGQPFSDALDTAAVARMADAVASAQTSHSPASGSQRWGGAGGVLLQGLYEWADIRNDGRIFAFLKEAGEATDWAYGPGDSRADALCAGQAFIRMSGRYGEPAMMQPTLEAASRIAARAAGPEGPGDGLSQSGTLFMTAPAYAQLYAATGDKAFLQFLDKEYKAVAGASFDKKAGLFCRGSLREEKGRPLFQGLENGWSFASLGRIIDALPKDEPSRKYYIDLYKQMARAVAETQDAGGSWHESLHDAGSPSATGSSASALFCRGLAWGMRKGYISRRDYFEILRKGWEALCRQAPVAGAPDGLRPEEACDTGCFLLAAAEIWQLCAGDAGKGLMNGREMDGYKGIWFNLGQESAYGFKYSGGLGTYTVKHNPMGVYAPQVDRTYFVYGGTTAADETHLLCMIGCYDHKTRKVQRPVCVFDKEGISDPHDNPSLQIDKDGYLWVFVSGRASGRLGHIFRSEKPYDIHQWRHIHSWIMTYPQPLYDPEQGFLLHYTRYDGVRRLYWSTSEDGTRWAPYSAMADIREGTEKQSGHYEVTSYDPEHGIIHVAFNRHIGGNCDLRTNIYYLQSRDWGKTWTTADGRAVQVPVRKVDDLSRILDAQSHRRNVYIKDVNHDADGNPVILFVSSGGAAPGPANDPRTWTVAHWNGKEWVFHDITASHHNYDSGCIHVEGKTWTVIAPTEDGPQYWGTGGEVAMWRSGNNGRIWKKAAMLTSGSPYNMGYCRRPYRAAPGFWSWWADGSPERMTRSTLYFCNKDGEVFVLPYEKMRHEWERPLRYNRND